MMRFLRENAELITSICVVLSLLLGGALLYLWNRAEQPVELPAAAVVSPAAVAPAPTATPVPEQGTAASNDSK